MSIPHTEPGSWEGGGPMAWRRRPDTWAKRIGQHDPSMVAQHHQLHKGRSLAFQRDLFDVPAIETWCQLKIVTIFIYQKQLVSVNLLNVNLLNLVVSLHHKNLISYLSLRQCGALTLAECGTWMQSTRSKWQVGIWHVPSTLRSDTIVSNAPNCACVLK